MEDKIISVNAETITPKYKNFNEFFHYKRDDYDGKIIYTNDDLNKLCLYFEMFKNKIGCEEDLKKIKDIYAVNTYIIKFNDLSEKIANDFNVVYKLGNFQIINVVYSDDLKHYSDNLVQNIQNRGAFYMFNIL